MGRGNRNKSTLRCARCLPATGILISVSRHQTIKLIGLGLEGQSAGEKASGKQICSLALSIQSARAVYLGQPLKDSHPRLSRRIDLGKVGEEILLAVVIREEGRRSSCFEKTIENIEASRKW